MKAQLLQIGIRLKTGMVPSDCSRVYIEPNKSCLLAARTKARAYSLETDYAGFVGTSSVRTSSSSGSPLFTGEGSVLEIIPAGAFSSNEISE